MKIVNRTHALASAQPYKNEDLETTEVQNMSNLINDDAIANKCYFYHVKNNTLQVNFALLFETQSLDKLAAPNHISQCMQQNNGIAHAQKIKNQIASTVLCAVNKNDRPTSKFDLL